MNFIDIFLSTGCWLVRKSESVCETEKECVCEKERKRERERDAQYDHLVLIMQIVLLF